MDDAESDVSVEDVRTVFDGLPDPSEPVTARDVAERLGCAIEVAENKLAVLGEQGEVKSKQLATDVLSWWRPESMAAHQSEASAADRSIPSSETPSTDLVERILEASPVSIVVVEPSGGISFANQRAAETLGLERETITDRTYHQPEWEISHDDGRPVARDEHPVTRVLETHEPVYGFEHWIELSDGTERWLSSNSAPVLDEDGEVAYVVVGFEDATPLKEREDKLTSDKRRLLELYSEQLFQPFLDAATGAGRIDIDEVVQLPDGTATHYITVTGISATAVAEIFERHFAVSSVRLLSSTDDRSRFEVRMERPTVPQIFEELGGTVTTLVRIDEDLPPVLLGELPGDVDPRTAIKEARAVHSDIELLSQELRYTPRLLYDIVESELTERQLMALQTAYYGGDFETPRTSAGGELAEQLGITRQTFNQHLRKAEQTVFTQLFEKSAKEHTD